MRTNIILILLFATWVQLGCKSNKDVGTYTSESLKIYPITENSFVHESYLETLEYGKVPCNGLIYFNNKEAVVFDTPTNHRASEELIQWIKKSKKAEIKGVIFNHFHEDCTGGQAIFRNEGIPSYAYTKTFDLLGNLSGTRVFKERLHLKVGKVEIVGHFLGKAHSEDNIVCYIPSEALLFGGCMVKSLGSKKGNLADADLGEWSNTVQKIKDNYPNLKLVVPGHGASGGTELLDYTIKLFKIK